MSTESFREQTRILLYRMLDEAAHTPPDQLAETYADMLARLHAAQSHQMLTQVLDDARRRLDARLSPDPLSQGIASVQTTVQDLWQSFWKD